MELNSVKDLLDSAVEAQYKLDLENVTFLLRKFYATGFFRI